MRLIDADKLKPTVGMFTYHGEGEDDSDYIAVQAYRCELIEKEAPTVKAIPIKWLEKEYLGEIRRAGCMPRSEVVKEIIERWRGEAGE